METQIAPQTIEKIREIVLATKLPLEQRMLSIHGRPHIIDASGEIVLVPIPEPDRLFEPDEVNLSTLTGLVDWFNFEAAHVDAEDRDKLLVHVVDPQTVEVYGARRGPYHQRFDYAIARASDLAGAAIGRDQRQADFIIWLLTSFLRVEGDDRALLLKIVGNIMEEDVRTSSDDGVTNIVTVRSGVTLVADANVPNIVRLHPRRTFPEIGPTPEELVVRVAKSAGGPLINLRSADAGSWRIDVVAKIAEWLREKLPTGAKVIA